MSKTFKLYHLFPVSDSFPVHSKVFSFHFTPTHLLLPNATITMLTILILSVFLIRSNEYY